MAIAPGDGGRLHRPTVLRRLAFLGLFLAACTSDPPGAAVPVAATAEALDASTVVVRFSRELVAGSASEADLSIFTPFVRPEQTLAITSREVSGDTLTLRTAPQTGGRLYAIRGLGALRFAELERADAPAQVNFEGFGLAEVTLSLDTTGFVAEGPLTALVTVDPATGQYTPDFRPLMLADEDGDGVFQASLEVRIDQNRVYAARAVTDSGGEAAALASFTVSSTAAVHVELEPRLDREPEFLPPVDDNPGDGLAPVRIVLDDRYARVLRRPAVRLAIDENGRFDLSLNRVEPARPVAGKPRVYELLVEVEVDPQRTIDGNTPDTFPYVTFLVNDGEDVNERAGNFTMPDETPKVVVIPIGNPALVPVTFRIDAGAAILEPDARLRGIYPGEGVFLTGEFPSAEDALGRLAADAFSGGERATLEMKERPDAPGVYEKTIFLPPNRPYGWKVVRCPSGTGCSELNRHVTSSGRAFPTVMKNLTTANVDAASSQAVRIIDPRRLDQVTMEDGSTSNYSGARVSTDGTEAPGTTVMFKQEAPDLVVTVEREPVITPIHVVGTWRDVNIPERPLDIIANGTMIELAPYDYDDGKQGRASPIRDLMLPLDPGSGGTTPGQPEFDATDGQLDATAVELSAPGRLPLWAAWNERTLYVATSPATAGRDHFVMISFDAPSETRPAQWAKAGSAAIGSRTIFLAQEGDGDFSGWFRRGAGGNDDTLIESPGAVSSRGQVLEGSFDTGGEGPLGGSVWIAVVAYGTSDGDPLISDVQNPAGNGDGNLDVVELTELRLGDLRAQ